MTSYGPFTDANGDLSLLRIPILFVASLPGSGLAPGIFYYQASDNGYYYWNGTSFVGPLGAGGGGGGGAPVGAQYVVMALDGTLTGERRLQVGAALSLVDGGANADVTLDRAALTGDVTATAGSNATTIANNAVSNAKLRDSNALSVIGRSLNSSGDPADIQATAASGAVLREAAGLLGFGTITQAAVINLVSDLAGKVPTARLINTTAPIAGGGDLSADRTISLNDNGVSDAKLRDSAALSVIGRASNTTGDPADIAAGTDAHVLRRSGTTLGFGQVATDGLADAAVTFAKVQNVGTDRLLGRDAAGSGAITEIECSGLLEFNTFNAIRIKPNATHAIMAANPTTGFAEWRQPANYPCYPLFRDASAQLIFPKISDGASFPGSPVDGQIFTHTGHGNTTYYYDATRGGWLGPPQTIWFSAQADRASVAYMNWSPTTTAFQDAFGPIFGYPVRVTAMGVFMQASGTATLQVFDDGAGITNASLALSSEISKKDMAMNSNTVAADSFLGVKVTSGTFEGPGVGFFEVRRFET